MPPQRKHRDCIGTYPDTLSFAIGLKGYVRAILENKIYNRSDKFNGNGGLQDVGAWKLQKQGPFWKSLQKGLSCNVLPP